MLCKGCGFNLGAVSKFCPSCGMTIEEMQAADNYPAANWPAPSPYNAPGTSPAMMPPPMPILSPPPMPASPMPEGAYYLMLNGQQNGPYTVHQLKTMWQSGAINASIYYWQAGLAEWQPLMNIRQFLDMPITNAPVHQIVVNQMNAPMPYQPAMGYATKSRAAFIVLGLFLGYFGIHNFYAGYSGKGVAQLLITIFGGWIFGIGFIITGIWALIEIIAVSTDANGYRMT